MNAIEKLLNLDITSVFSGIVIILFAIVALYELIGKVSIIINKPVGWVRKKNEDHELLMQTISNLSNLTEKQKNDVEQSIRHDKLIETRLNELTEIVVDMSIESWRWEILDFSSALSNGRIYNREAFDHIFRIYKKYEDILNNNNLENGLIDNSIKFIREKYNDFLKNGELS